MLQEFNSREQAFVLKGEIKISHATIYDQRVTTDEICEMSSIVNDC